MSKVNKNIKMVKYIASQLAVVYASALLLDCPCIVFVHREAT